MSGCNMPFLAISIIPDENVAPVRTPTEATIRTTYRGAIFVPTDEFKKFAASLLTPTNKSSAANNSNITTNTNTIVPNISFLCCVLILS